MATRFKATTPKCASEEAPGNTTALCADCLWNKRCSCSSRYVKLHCLRPSPLCNDKKSLHFLEKLFGLVRIGSVRLLHAVRRTTRRL
ncbi:Hypothetical predicted protein [Xyrichtys novacula]|uniref:Uncharacterized protein n=1 Tax=Xyrichtys novacula TaxID=13765 RepID=A0AAV1GMQ0_XYRNO|nr:Hypothetical predicted protein [Xyrichtys novacula]